MRRGERVEAVEVGQVDGPRLRIGRVLAALREHLVQQLGAARADPDGRAALGEAEREAFTDPGRRAGDEDMLARKVVRHPAKLEARNQRRRYPAPPEPGPERPGAKRQERMK